MAFYYYFDPEVNVVPNGNDILGFSVAAVICFALAALFAYWGRRANGDLYRREGLAVVVIIWFLTPAIAALPFLTTGTLTNPFQAYFEATSGATTTGSSVLAAKLYDPATQEEIPYRQVIHGSIDTEYVFFGNVSPLRDSEGNIVKEGVEAVSKPCSFGALF